MNGTSRPAATTTIVAVAARSRQRVEGGRGLRSGLGDPAGPIPECQCGAPFGDPADSGSPVALRPRLATGVLFRGGQSIPTGIASGAPAIGDGDRRWATLPSGDWRANGDVVRAHWLVCTGQCGGRRDGLQEVWCDWAVDLHTRRCADATSGHYKARMAVGKVPVLKYYSWSIGRPPGIARRIVPKAAWGCRNADLLGRIGERESGPPADKTRTAREYPIGGSADRVRRGREHRIVFRWGRPGAHSQYGDGCLRPRF